MDLRFYNLNGSLVFISNDYIKVRWKECWQDEGECDLYFLSGNEVFEHIKQPSLVRYNNRFAYITGYSFEGEFLRITAKPLITLLSRRVVMGEDITLDGMATELLTAQMSAFCPYIALSGSVPDSINKTILLEPFENLLSVAKRLLEGTKTGLCVNFDPPSATFTYSFLNPKKHEIRLSEANRNLSGVKIKTDYTNKNNACYYTEYFKEPTEIKISKLTDNSPSNYMKQFIALDSGKVGDLVIGIGNYVYSDTKDGKLKIADTEQISRIRYMSLEERPTEVFESNLTKLEFPQANSLLSVRQYTGETFLAYPSGEALKLGDIVSIERKLGAQKGIEEMQVKSICYDTEKPIPEIILG